MMENLQSIKDANEIVKLTELKQDPTNLRKKYSNIEELAKSIQSLGQMVPIEVNENYLITDGHRRFQALTQLKREHAWIIKVPCKDEAERKTRQLTYEAQIQKVSVWERDAAWYKLYKQMKKTLPEFAKLMGVSPSTICSMIDRIETGFSQSIIDNVCASDVAGTRNLPKKERITLLNLAIQNHWNNRADIRQATKVCKENPSLKQALLEGKIKPCDAHTILKSGVKDFKQSIKMVTKLNQIKEQLIEVKNEPGAVVTKKDNTDLVFNQSVIKLSKNLFSVIHSTDIAHGICDMLHEGLKSGGTLPLPLKTKLKEIIQISQDNMKKLNLTMNRLAEVI